MENFKKYSLISGGFLIVLATVAIVGHANRPADKHIPEMKWDPIIRELDAKREAYGSGAAMIADLTEQIGQLQEKIDTENVEMQKIALSAASYDTILCTDYGVSYVRSGSGAPFIKQGCKHEVVDTTASIPPIANDDPAAHMPPPYAAPLE